MTCSVSVALLGVVSNCIVVHAQCAELSGFIPPCIGLKLRGVLVNSVVGFGDRDQFHSILGIFFIYFFEFHTECFSIGLKRIEIASVDFRNSKFIFVDLGKICGG